MLPVGVFLKYLQILLLGDLSNWYIDNIKLCSSSNPHSTFGLSGQWYSAVPPPTYCLLTELLGTQLNRSLSNFIPTVLSLFGETESWFGAVWCSPGKRCPLLSTFSSEYDLKYVICNNAGLSLFTFSLEGNLKEEGTRQCEISSRCFSSSAHLVVSFILTLMSHMALSPTTSLNPFYHLKMAS